MSDAAHARASRGDARLLADVAAVGRLTDRGRASARDRLAAELGPDRARTLVDSLSLRLRTIRTRVS